MQFNLDNAHQGLRDAIIKSDQIQQSYGDICNFNQSALVNISQANINLSAVESRLDECYQIDRNCNSSLSNLHSKVENHAQKIGLVSKAFTEVQAAQASYQHDFTEFASQSRARSNKISLWILLQHQLIQNNLRAQSKLQEVVNEQTRSLQEMTALGCENNEKQAGLLVRIQKLQVSSSENMVQQQKLEKDLSALFSSGTCSSKRSLILTSNTGSPTFRAIAKLAARQDKP